MRTLIQTLLHHGSNVSETKPKTTQRAKDAGVDRTARGGNARSASAAAFCHSRKGTFNAAAAIVP
jgi:hypothetical protein